jgi:hypothetical protein
VGLARYRQLLLERAQAEMQAEYKIVVEQTQAIQVQVNSWIG